MREVFLPILWFGVTADLTDNLLSWIHFTLVGPYVGSACFFAAFAASMISLAISGVKYSKARKQQNKTDEEPSEDQIKSDDASAEAASTET